MTDDDTTYFENNRPFQVGRPVNPREVVDALDVVIRWCRAIEDVEEEYR